MNIVIRADLQAYIDPLTEQEHAALERSILAEGCRDALVLWGEVLVDGHNRYAICRKHGLPFQTVSNPRFDSLESVHLWMIDQHLARRSISDFQRGVLALRKQEIVADRQARAQFARGAEPAGAGASASASSAPWDTDGSAAGAPEAQPSAQAAALNTREDIARAARLSGNQVVMIEKIQKQAAPEVVAAVRAGTLSINAAAAVASLSTEEQVAAAEAGPDELKQAARRVREAKRKPREAGAAKAATTPDSPGAAPDGMEPLRKRLAELSAENVTLRLQVIELQAALATATAATAGAQG
jgi:hypothetical protein